MKFVVPLVFLAFVILCSLIPSLAEWYMQVCYPAVATALSFVSRRTAFSLFDLLIIAAIVTFLGSVVMMFMKKVSFRRWGKTFLLSVLWMIVWFYMSWGIGYFRLDFYERFGIEQPKEDREFFEALVARYIDSLNRTFVAEPHFDAAEIDREIEYLFKKHHELLRLPHPCGWRRTKRTVIEPLMTRMGVAGYFAPFFNEVHINNFILPITYPYTLAHEKAHQFGITSEAECNLIATIICTSSSHPLVRYSGYLQTTSYLLNNLQIISPERYREIVGQLDPRIIADYRKIRDHWREAINPTLSAIQDRVYDTYLKTNRQRSGILSYSEVTGLLVAWEQKLTYNKNIQSD